ncbi:DNA repair protein RecO [Candidatus Synechococcus calcipolaris G9]|uniref:DNA repair protein RecO n=1 Tax=Candidatus Synechococcus calcipolaris G9 TaxID=1497997 RepID=A0ABT6EZT1_9SYNE|nr:DNA repair protein RecO [Candidatus Synechococcus calcipolaris]MDG2991120.1 DNA repair protein RecO [Candidatus Synechococcus calcipolaris G9]
MGRTYTTTGINLKSMPLGEADRLLTILTPEAGLIRLVAPGCRKPRSKLGGRTALLVVNQLFVIEGRSLDKISQAETLASYPGLMRQLPNLTAGQYLGELILYQALSDHPQGELFTLICQTLAHLEQVFPEDALAILLRAIFSILELTGIAPRWDICLQTGRPLETETADIDWRVGFSFAAGGPLGLLDGPDQRGGGTAYQSMDIQLTVAEVCLGQWLAQRTIQNLEIKDFLDQRPPYSLAVWLALEKVLRHYIQFHLEKPLRVAPLFDVCFSPISQISVGLPHDR